MARRAGGALGDAKRHRHSGHGVVEGDPHLGFQVGAAHGPRPGVGLAAGPVEQTTEEVTETAGTAGSPGIAEDVAHVEAAGTRSGSGSSAGAGEAAERTGGHQVAGLVVLLALRVVRQDVIGFGNRLELVLGALVARILVRMQVTGELAVGLLDLGARRVLRDAKLLVEVLFVIVLGAHPEPPFSLMCSWSLLLVRAVPRHDCESSYLGTALRSRLRACGHTGRSAPSPLSAAEFASAAVPADAEPNASAATIGSFAAAASSCSGPVTTTTAGRTSRSPRV